MTAAVFPRVDKKIRKRLFVVAMVFAVATALLVVGAINLHLVDLQSGINLNQKQFDAQGIYRFYIFWLAAIGFYGGSFAFSYAIIDLLFVIANLSGIKKQPKGKNKRKSIKPESVKK